MRTRRAYDSPDGANEVTVGPVRHGVHHGRDGVHEGGAVLGGHVHEPMPLLAHVVDPSGMPQPCSGERRDRLGGGIQDQGCVVVVQCLQRIGIGCQHEELRIHDEVVGDYGGATVDRRRPHDPGHRDVGHRDVAFGHLSREVLV